MPTNKGDEGFGLVEIVISMFLLGLIAIALLPALANGLGISAQQSTVATATRQVNGLVDQVRAQGCGNLDILFGTPDAGGIRHRPFPALPATPDFVVTTTVTGTCTNGATMSLHIVATKSGSGSTLFTADALMMIPPTPVPVPTP